MQRSIARPTVERRRPRVDRPPARAVRARPGQRGALHSHAVGPSGDHYTGLLATAAGVVAVGLGIATTWRARRTDGSRVRRYARRAGLGAMVVLVTYNVVFPVALAYVYTHVSTATPS
jgi:hypothetical protein